MGAALTVAATLATAPLMAFHFERVSLAALPANLAALPAIPLVMWTGMLSAAAAQVWIVPAELLNALNGFFLAYVAAVARWGARLPGAVVEVGIDGPLQLAIAYAVLAGTLWAAWRLRAAPRRGAALAGACALVAVAAAVLLLRGHAPAPPSRFTVTFLDVGQGDATLIQAPGGLAALVDGGPPEADVASKLRARGVTRARPGGAHARAGGPPGWSRGRARALPGRRPARRRQHRRRARTTGASWRWPAHGRRRVVPAAAGQRFRLGPALRLDVLAPAVGARRPARPRPESARRGAPPLLSRARRAAAGRRRERGHGRARPAPRSRC